MGDSTEALDGTWSVEHITGLVEGEVLTIETDERGREVEMIRPRDTAYELRIRALDGNAPVDTVLDAVQLVEAARRLTDPEARAFLAASVALGAVRWWQAEDAVVAAGLRGNRSGKQVWQRAIQLVQRHERARYRQLSRVRSGIDGPVCWRCMKQPVLRIGDECGTCAGPAGADGRAAKPVEQMTLDELVATQQEPRRGKNGAYNRIIPGGSYYEKKVSPGGSGQEVLGAARAARRHDDAAG